MFLDVFFHNSCNLQIVLVFYRHVKICDINLILASITLHNKASQELQAKISILCVKQRVKFSISFVFNSNSFCFSFNLKFLTFPSRFLFLLLFCFSFSNNLILLIIFFATILMIFSLHSELII